MGILLVYDTTDEKSFASKESITISKKKKAKRITLNRREKLVF